MLRRLLSLRFPAASSSTLALTAAMLNTGWFPWRSLPSSTRRSKQIDGGAEILVALAERHQRHAAADRAELALKILDPPPIICQRADLIAAVQLGDLESDGLRVRAAAGEGEEMALVRPDSIRHPIAVLRFQQTFTGQPAIRDDVELTVLTGEHQHQGRHVAGGAEVQTGITRPPLQAGDINLTAAHLPHRHIEELSGCFAPHVENQVLEARFGGGHASALAGRGASRLRVI